jgi:hypothetical protein
MHHRRAQAHSRNKERNSCSKGSSFCVCVKVAKVPRINYRGRDDYLASIHTCTLFFFWCALLKCSYLHVQIVSSIYMMVLDIVMIVGWLHVLSWLKVSVIM